ncbi:hypothetical protein FB451DRAFT_1189308 [Mycena latifolia]|nr:hypothetical protein FB451DRAFT_1189308 [Mycena latifolia]
MHDARFERAWKLVEAALTDEDGLVVALDKRQQIDKIERHHKERGYLMKAEGTANYGKVGAASVKEISGVWVIGRFSPHFTGYPRKEKSQKSHRQRGFRGISKAFSLTYSVWVQMCWNHFFSARFAPPRNNLNLVREIRSDSTCNHWEVTGTSVPDSVEIWGNYCANGIEAYEGLQSDCPPNILEILGEPSTAGGKPIGRKDTPLSISPKGQGPSSISSSSKLPWNVTTKSRPATMKCSFNLSSSEISWPPAVPGIPIQACELHIQVKFPQFGELETSPPTEYVDDVFIIHILVSETGADWRLIEQKPGQGIHIGARRDFEDYDGGKGFEPGDPNSEMVDGAGGTGKKRKDCLFVIKPEKLKFAEFGKCEKMKGSAIGG